MEDSFIVDKKIASDKKWEGSEAGKPWTLKSGGLEPRSLTEVYVTPMTLIKMSLGMELGLGQTTLC